MIHGNKLGKRDKLQGLVRFLLRFYNRVNNKFNNTGALMLDSSCHVTLKLF